MNIILALLKRHLSVIWASFERHLRIIWASFERHLSIIWASFESHLRIIWASFEPHFSVIKASFERHLGVIWASFERHLIVPLSYVLKSEWILFSNVSIIGRKSFNIEKFKCRKQNYKTFFLPFGSFLFSYFYKLSVTRF